jgi:RNA polymerase sigma factor (sigma-70 family)
MGRPIIPSSEKIMAAQTLHALVRHLRRTLEASGASEATDADLLQHWVTRRDEAAFEVLLWRHGPIVLGVCRRLLSQPSDVEDAFQATFLALVRKASSIRQGQSVASWLYKVAYRAALRLRARAPVSVGTVDLPAPDENDELLWRDLRSVLDAEIDRLPERYRAAFVLCCLQGKTNEAAARELGCPVGTILSRLSWARERLRWRLARRGVTLSAGVLAITLARNAAAATVPTGLAGATLQIALCDAIGRAADVLPAHVAALTQEVLRAMTFSRIKMTAAIALALSALVAGGIVATTSLDAKETLPPSENVSSTTPAPVQKETIDVPSPRSGVLVVIGTEIKAGEKVPPGDVVTLKAGGETKKYRRLKVGDKVEEGQLLARLDDRLARDEVAIAEARVEAAEAEHRAAGKTTDEARRRYESISAQNNRVPGSVSQDELQGALLSLHRYTEEAIAKKLAIAVARKQLESAKTIQEMHEIRSPVKGTVAEIYKRRGEAVKELERVIRLHVDREDQ